MKTTTCEPMAGTIAPDHVLRMTINSGERVTVAPLHSGVVVTFDGTEPSNDNGFWVVPGDTMPVQPCGGATVCVWNPDSLFTVSVLVTRGEAL